MPTDDLATARTMIDAWNEGNVSRLIDFWHDDGVWEDFPQTPDRAVVHGREAIEDHLRDVIDILGVLHLTVDDFSRVGDEVLISGSMQLEGAHSGIETDARWFGLVRFEGRRVRRYRNFFSREEALAAAEAG
jgi:ketosteroid isomerase-like protein